MAMFRANWALLLTLTGVFIFFPALVLFVVAPMSEAQPDASAQAAVQQIIDYYQANVLWLVLANAIAAFGQAAILVMLLDRRRPTVGEALGVAGTLFPGFFVAQMITNFATGAALMLLVVPGVYLIGRFAVVGPLLVARRLGNPLRAIVQAWDATARRGWRIAGLFVLVVVVGWIVLSAASSILTILASFLAPESARPLIGGFVGGLSSAGLALLIVIVSAAIYRQVGEVDRIGDIFG